MEGMIRVAALAAAAVLCAAVIRRGSGEFSLLLVLAAGTCILLLAMEPLAQVVESITRISRLAQLDGGLVRPVLKTVAISILTKITAELCKSSGEGGLAAFVETPGTALALAVAAPLAENVLTLMAELLV